jgi:hypothetical protein
VRFTLRASATDPLSHIWIASSELMLIVAFRAEGDVIVV